MKEHIHIRPKRKAGYGQNLTGIEARILYMYIVKIEKEKKELSIKCKQLSKTKNRNTTEQIEKARNKLKTVIAKLEKAIQTEHVNDLRWALEVLERCGENA